MRLCHLVDCRSGMACELATILALLLLVTPVSLDEVPGHFPQPCASMSSASGAGLTLVTAGLVHKFSITARDENGLPLSSRTDATFVTRLAVDATARATVAQSADPAVHVGYLESTLSGPDMLSIHLAECELRAPKTTRAETLCCCLPRTRDARTRRGVSECQRQ